MEKKKTRMGGINDDDVEVIDGDVVNMSEIASEQRERIDSEERCEEMQARVVRTP